MKTKPLWQEVTTNISFPKLQKNLTCDVLIIGGGLAGISTAFCLKDSSFNVALIESHSIGMGVSSRSTAKLTFLQELIYQKLEKIFDEKTAYLYYQSQVDAIAAAKKNIEENNIDCNFEIVDSYTFTNQEKEKEKFEKEMEFFEKNNIPFERIFSLPNLFPCSYGIRVSDTAVFHPVKYIIGLAKILKKKKFPIFENTCAQTLTKTENGYEIQTSDATIYAKKVIVCTHYPFFVKPGWIPFRNHLEKDYICVGKIKNSFSFSAITSSLPTHSIRFFNDKDSYLIYLGNAKPTSKGFDEKEEICKIVSDFQTFFSIKPAYAWSNHDLMTNDSLPMIGKLNKNNPDLYIATGFNTWGMTNGILAGQILSDLILGNENPYAALMRPDRMISVQKITSFFQDIYQNTSSIIKTKIHKQKDFYPSCIKMRTENGKSIGIYTDSDKKEHKVRNLCPHMKCSLIFNSVEHTWDCPCHGSKFSIDGEVLNGPSVYPIQENES